MVIELIKKGMKNPKRIPPYFLGKIVPSTTQSHWRSGDQVQFKQGGYVTHAGNRPEFAAAIYYETELFNELLSETDFSKSLEIGCGYGRLSPWLADYSESHTGIDIDSEALEVASKLHPDLSFKQEDVADLPFEKSRFDLVITNTVLHHIPPNVFSDAIDNISRVVSKNGTVIISEATKGPGNDKTWVRSVNEYENWFKKYGFHLEGTMERNLPWVESEWINTAMIFSR